jgi:hypothetical protein
MVLTHYLVFGLATIPAEAQSRADSLDVLVAVLDHFAADDAPLLLGDDVPQLVIDAAALRGGETLEVPSNVPVFCEGRLAEELITPEDLVGRRVFVSLRPGSGPLPTRVAQGDSTGPETEPRDPLESRMSIWSPAFYLDRAVAYVSVSASCIRRPGGGGLQFELDDGRRVSNFSYGSTFELRREEEGWAVVRTISGFMS